jgi:predicted acylesterase/phospholipase RssA
MSEASEGSDERISEATAAACREAESLALEMERVRAYFAEQKRLLVVAFDGGGIRGLFQAHVLKRLEDEVSGHLGREFRFERETWLASGTSTGGILAAGLATPTGSLARQPRRSTALIELYEDLACEVFGGRGHLRLLRQAVRAKHDPAPLEAALQEHLGDARLREADPQVLIPAYSEAHKRTWWFDTNLANARARSPWRYKGWTAPNPALENPRLRDVCRATSAAPTFFPPAYLEDRSLGRWIDAGVGANNPTLAAAQSALAELRQRRQGLFGRQRQLASDMNPQILLLSLGNGVRAPTVPSGQGGRLQWVARIPALFMQASATTNDGLAEELAQFREHTSSDTWVPVMSYYRITPPDDARVADLDDASKLGELRDLALEVSSPQTGKVPRTPFQEAVKGIVRFFA